MRPSALVLGSSSSSRHGPCAIQLRSQKVLRMLQVIAEPQSVIDHSGRPFGFAPQPLDLGRTDTANSLPPTASPQATVQLSAPVRLPLNSCRLGGVAFTSPPYIYRAPSSFTSPPYLCSAPSSFMSCHLPTSRPVVHCRRSSRALFQDGSAPHSPPLHDTIFAALDRHRANNELAISNQNRRFSFYFQFRLTESPYPPSSPSSLKPELHLVPNRASIP
jgi:hypothetical protein